MAASSKNNPARGISKRDAEATRRALLAGGEKVFAERSFEGATYDLLAAAAGVNKALALNPESGLTLLARAETLAQAGQRDQAIADYRKVLEIDPMFVSATMKTRAEAGLNSLEVSP